MVELYRLIQHTDKYYLELRYNWGQKDQEKIFIRISKKEASKLLKFWGLEK